MELRLTEFPEPSKFGVNAVSASVLVASYLLTVFKIGPSYMKSRPAFNLKSYIVIYNIHQICTCIYLLYKVSVIDLPWIHFWKCIDFIPRSKVNTDYHHIAYILFWLKVSELTETLVFVLRRKNNQVSFLHVFHHCCAIFMTYHFNHSYNNSGALFPVFLNTFVHLIMYTYYLMAATLPTETVKNLTPLKKNITRMQMTQFALILVQVIIGLCRGCELPKDLVICYITMISVIFYMFYDFYQKSYNKKQNEKLKKDQIEFNEKIKCQTFN